MEVSLIKFQAVLTLVHEARKLLEQANCIDARVGIAESRIGEAQAILESAAYAGGYGIAYGQGMSKPVLMQLEKGGFDAN